MLVCVPTFCLSFISATIEDPKVPLGPLKRFFLKELQLVTENFSVTHLLGNGAFGSVYKGCLTDDTVVAIKRRKKEHTQFGEQQFLTELQMISLHGCAS